MGFKLTPPAEDGEFEKAKSYFYDLGIWEEVKNQSPDDVIYCYRWRTKPVSLAESLKDTNHRTGELSPPIKADELKQAKLYFQQLGIWEEVKHQDDSSLVYCYRWRHANRT